jgi:hypothetical protein
MIDINGKWVFEKDLEKPTHESEELKIKLNAGIYFLNISQNKKNLSMKLMVE